MEIMVTKDSVCYGGFMPRTRSSCVVVQDPCPCSSPGSRSCHGMSPDLFESCGGENPGNRQRNFATTAILQSPPTLCKFAEGEAFRSTSPSASAQNLCPN
jgi:hypothetical protein